VLVNHNHLHHFSPEHAENSTCPGFPTYESRTSAYFNGEDCAHGNYKRQSNRSVGFGGQAPCMVPCILMSLNYFRHSMGRLASLNLRRMQLLHINLFSGAAHGPGFCCSDWP
jgi:hypothetical protein